MRYRTATRVALCGISAAGIVGAGLFACNDVIKDTPISLSEREAGGGGGSSGNGPTAPTSCKSSCCPSEEKCFVSGKEGPGAECMATRDNTDKRKIQIRQTWVYPTTPAGLAIPGIYGILNLYTQFPACATPAGATGYIRVMETDLDTDISRVGWSKFVPKAGVDDVLQNGFCMLQSEGEGWSDPQFALPQSAIYTNPRYPEGLPQPAGQPWKVRPTQARRLREADFALERFQKEDGAGAPVPLSATARGALTDAGQAKRRELLKKTLDQENVDKEVTGFFYMDEEAGTIHGFATIAWQVLYNLGTEGASYFVVPIHEPETFQRYTNPQQRNCVGIYRAGQEEGINCAGTNAANDPAGQAWSGVDNVVGTADAWTKGYFLIAELEQIYVDTLKSTLCISYPGEVDMNKWTSPTAVPKSCRQTGLWDATKPATNMPRGDWCSETNGPATPDCADAWLTIAYHAFAGANVREGTCAP
jgi:hypothetical protein